jgi:hypothetical protein
MTSQPSCSISRQDLALHHCFVALSTLHISQPNSTTRDEWQKQSRYDTIAAYQQSVTILRVDLARPNQTPDETALWTTFFLGIFEVGRSLFCLPTSSPRLSLATHFLHTDD